MHETGIPNITNTHKKNQNKCPTNEKKIVKDLRPKGLNLICVA